jgi:hypothetical protein
MPVAMDVLPVEEPAEAPRQAPRVAFSLAWRVAAIAIGVGLGCWSGAPGRGDVATRAVAQLVERPMLNETFDEPLGERLPMPAATAPVVMTDVVPPSLRAPKTAPVRWSRATGARK